MIRDNCLFDLTLQKIVYLTNTNNAECGLVICEWYKVGLLSYGPFPGVGTRRVGRGVSWCSSSELCLSNVLDVFGCVSSMSSR